MWRTLHVLSPVQSLALASFSAASLALPLAVQSISRDQTALYLRDLFWPDTLYVDAYVNFSLFFIGVLPALLGYYHLGRLGFLLNVAAGFALAWIMAVCWILCLVAISGGVVLEAYGPAPLLMLHASYWCTCSLHGSI